MSEKEKTINIEFNLGNGKIVQECDTNDKQPEKNHYKKIQEAKDGQELIQELVKVINSIGNIDEFTKELKQYITKYAIFKKNHSGSNFKIRDIKFEYGKQKDATLKEIIATSFHNNDTMINLYDGIIKQFDRVCNDLDEVFNIPYNFNSFETFMNNLSLKTISPLTIELCYSIINKHISTKAKNIVCETQEDTDKLNACKNKFINLYNRTQTVRKELKNGLSDGEKDLAFEKYNSTFNKHGNYLPLVKDEYNRNYLHYAWKHFEGVSAQNGFLEKIKARLLQYAGNDKENIKQACTEKDVYGLTPLCYVLIEAFDGGINKKTVKDKLNYVLEYFKELKINTQLAQTDLQAIYDYFQITKNIQGQQHDYQDFIDTMKDHIQKTTAGKIPHVKTDKKYIPQTKFNAKINKEQTQSNEVSVETFLSDDGGYKDKVGDFVDSLFWEVYNTSTQIGEEKGSGYYKENYIKEEYDKTYSAIINICTDKIKSIKQDEKLKYISNDSTYNTLNRNNYCKLIFIKALEQKYDNTNNPDIMFKFLSDFCESDMAIKMNKDNYIQIIKYFLNNPAKITDDVKQNIKSLTRYIITTDIVNNNFIQEIITKDSTGSFGLKEQDLIQDIILTAIDNNINFGNTTKDLVSQLNENGFGGTSNILGTIQQNLSPFKIVKNLILSGNIQENTDFSKYSGLTYEEKTQLKQILAKTIAVTKIIKEGKQDCSKLKYAVINFVSSDIGLTIEDIAQIKVDHKSISKFCEENARGNKKCAYYSWFLNKLVVNNYIANNHSGNTIERSGSREQLLQSGAEHDILPKNIVLDTYEEFENYKNNFIKKNGNSQPHKIFQIKYMNDNTNILTGKRSKIHYQNIKSVYEYEKQINNNDYNYNETLKNIVSKEEQDNITEDLKKYKLQQKVNANKEKSEEFKKFCTVFNLIRANTLLFDAIKGNNKQNSTQKQHGGYNKL